MTISRFPSARSLLPVVFVLALGVAACAEDGAEAPDDEEAAAPDDAAGELDVDEEVQIRLSHQPAYHTLPSLVAEEQGWFDDLRLEVTDLTIFASGAPQVEAGARGDWDAGALGTVPMLVGASQHGMQMIGMSNDESIANTIYVREDVDTSDPAGVLRGSRILASLISTGEYAMRGCLEAHAVSDDEVEVVNLEQAAILSSSIAGEGDVFQYWAPFTYQAEERANQQLLCSGEDAGIVIPGAIVATQEAVDGNREAVVRWLAGYLRGMALMREDPEETIPILRDFYQEQGIDLSDESLMREFERPTLPVDDQIDWLTGDGEEDAEQVMGDIAEFFVEAGTLPGVPEPDDYIDASLMEEVRDRFGDFVDSP